MHLRFLSIINGGSLAIPEVLTVDEPQGTPLYSIEATDQRVLHQGNVDLAEVPGAQVDTSFGCDVLKGFRMLDQLLGNQKKPFAAENLPNGFSADSWGRTETCWPRKLSMIIVRWDWRRLETAMG